MPRPRILAIALLAAIAAFAPVTLPSSSEPDLSYHTVLHESWHRGWIYGRDLCVTFGPWGFLFCGYHPRTWLVSCAAALLLAIAFASGATRLVPRVFSVPRGPRVPRFLGVSAGETEEPRDSRDPRHPNNPGNPNDPRTPNNPTTPKDPRNPTERRNLRNPNEPRNPRNPRTPRTPRNRGEAVLYPLAACGLMLFGGPDVRFFAIPILLLILLVRDDRMATVLAAAAGLVSLVKFSFLVASVVVLVPFLRRRPATAVAFAGGVVVAWLVAAQPLFALPRFLVCGFDVATGYAGGAAFPSPDPPTLAALVIALIAGVAFASWDVRRADAIAAIALFTAVLCKSMLVRSDDVHVLAGAMSLALLILGISEARVMVIGAEIAIVAFTLPLQANRWIAIAHGRAPLEAARLERLGRERLPRMNGTADAYPFGAAALINGGTRYVPRPSVESYMAFTPRLERADLANAPDHLVFFVSPVNHHLPSSEDALAWVAIEANYEFERTDDGGVAILRRRAHPLAFVKTPLANRDARADQWIDVPQSGDRLWCAIEVEPHPLEALLIRPRLIALDIKTAGGATWHYTVVPAIAREGFLLSPLVTTTSDFILGANRRVVAIRADQAMRVRFSALVRTPALASGNCRAPCGPRTSLRR